MDFIIKYTKSESPVFKYQFNDQIQSINNIVPNTLYIEKLNHLHYSILESASEFTIYAGDVITNSLPPKIPSADIPNSPLGIYYSFIFSHNFGRLNIICDPLSLLPIFYFIADSNIIYISSSFNLLSNLLMIKTINDEFYPQLALLYTPLGSTTYYKEIHRLGYGEVIALSDQFNINKLNRFYDYFTNTPESISKSEYKIAELFIERSKYYLNQPCAISLTGGFDGRTLTGCALYHKSDFINFSYGRKGNGDVDNPIYLSNQLGTKYLLIELDADYLDTEYDSCVKEYIKLSGGLNGFQYPQSLYYAKFLSSIRPLIITGYLGSELLASVKKSDDEITSQFILSYLESKESVLEYFNHHKNLLLNLGLITREYDVLSIISYLDNYFSNLPDYLTTNQKFATFSFENTYRNVFGTWIYNGMHYGKIRVPFIDRPFMEALIKSELSQFYRPFKEQNPITRVKGQLLYPLVLKLVSPELNRLTSSKGYSPSEVSTKAGLLMIFLKRLLQKNKLKEPHGLDKVSTVSGAIRFIDSNVSFDNHSQREEIRESLKSNSITRSWCFLSLTKKYSEVIFK